MALLLTSFLNDHFSRQQHDAILRGKEVERALVLERLEPGSHIELGLGLDNKDGVVGYGSLLGPKTHVALRTP